MALAARVMPLISARPMSTPPARRSWRVRAAKAPIEASSATTAKNTHWYLTCSSEVSAPASSSRRPNRALNATTAAPTPIPHRRAWPSHRRPRFATGGATLWSLEGEAMSSSIIDHTAAVRVVAGGQAGVCNATYDQVEKEGGPDAARYERARPHGGQPGPAAH